MFPWLMFWSPHYYFPFSGSVAQRIEPDTDWFFAGIPAKAGNAEMEKKIFETASYGRQLGWITELLLGMHSDDAKVKAQADKSLDCLRKTAHTIEAMKEEDRAALAAAAAAALTKLRDADPAAYDALLAASRSSAS